MRAIILHGRETDFLRSTEMALHKRGVELKWEWVGSVGDLLETNALEMRLKIGRPSKKIVVRFEQVCGH